ncbi:ABC transporter ATP-binding protein [Mesorhizobium tianshanense]|uniref:Peptide/nickel transport system ATP-binding protein/oligopeptide transport system ATP-binding protein n=1 Tax=Mesorhizobium tianshanense TaxID=39844 RepID=A0A562MGV4_9HYPH|nr:ABC transporter ATP-binding protein [Mesorhizobium tianshanense]TWI19177.1 peptide/nickel transport system ATP-binding protein/oligopeptide transport system ATP-binding protein [Mesorhizobium tianshanense]
MNPASLLTVTAVSRSFASARGLFGPKARMIKAVDDVTFSIGRKETLALVGESGSGKSTTGRIALGLMKPTSGTVHYENEDLFKLGGAAWRQSRRNMQMIFQDSAGALDPRMPVGAQIEEVLSVYGLAGGKSARHNRVVDALDRVGLGGASIEHRLPRELSGGQRQRIAIARALAMQAKLIVCDEPVSALDVSVQAQIVNLLMEMQQVFGLSYLFISHDLRVVRHISHRVAVMYLGRIVEIASTADIFKNPHHPYTQALLAAVPTTRRHHPSAGPLLGGELQDPASASSGCRFQGRCPFSRDICRWVEPALVEVGQGRQVACHLAVRADTEGGGRA